MAEALTTVTTAMLTTERGRPEPKALRAAALRAFNPNTREDQHSDEVSSALRWLKRNTRPVVDLAESKVLLGVVAALGRKIDSGRAAGSTARRKRMTLTNALDYAVTCDLLTTKPLSSVKTPAAHKPKVLRQVERRSVVNPVQARTLLNAVRDSGETGNDLSPSSGASTTADYGPKRLYG